ncbi:MAG: type I glyceraldehyde-3-phosphate dehydrogenase [Candidatus Gribaldobacteria bacterium]|nr:type I glyceraldehyde-3-phosphate dehydrogenase [Candidatus Gribaldobacteria bacterium]
MTKIAINGFGRIGMLAAKRVLEKHPLLQLVAVNDLAQQDFGGVKFLAEKDPANLPWRELGVDIVLECSGFFTEIDGAQKHLLAGAKKVIISAPSDSPEIPTYLLGVNAEKYNPAKDNIISMGSCTTNAVAPIAKILDKRFGVKAGFINTVHSYTNSQNKQYPNWRTDPASQLSIIPSTTGASKTVEKCLPQLAGKLNGLSLRVPTEDVSIVEFVFLAKKKATAQQVNEILRKAAERKEGASFRNILKFENKKLISSDLKGSEYSSIVDGSLTQTFGKLIKVFAWYDNEYGYACRLAEMAEFIGKGK